MKINFRIFVHILILSHLFSLTSQAQVYFDETFFPVLVSKNDVVSDAGGGHAASVPTESGLGYDLRTTIGYVFWTRMLVGLSFNMYTVNTSRPRTASYEGLEKQTSKNEWGPTIGFIWAPWKFILNYYISGGKTVAQKYTDTSTGAVSTDETYENEGESGYQFGVSYGFAVGAGFSIGPSLIYRSVKYSKQSYAVRTGSGTPYSMSGLQTPAIETELRPMISISFVY